MTAIYSVATRGRLALHTGPLKIKVWALLSDDTELFNPSLFAFLGHHFLNHILHGAVKAGRRVWFSGLAVWLTSCALFSVVCLCFKVSQSNRPTPVVCPSASLRSLLISSVVKTAGLPWPALAEGRGDDLFVKNSLSIKVISSHERRGLTYAVTSRKPSLNRTCWEKQPPSRGYASAGSTPPPRRPLKDQVPPLTLDGLAFVLSNVPDRLCLSRLKVFRDGRGTFPVPGWLTRLRSKLADVRDGTVFSAVSALTERNWLARPLSRLFTVFKWLLLPCS